MCLIKTIIKQLIMVNKVILVGRLGKDPEVKHLESGRSVANFSVATSEKYTKDGEKKEITEWHNIVAWGKLAEIIEKYVTKGTLIYVEGKLTTRSWDAEDGTKRYKTEVVIDSMKMLGGGSENSTSTVQEAEVVESDDGTLPF